MAGMAPLPQNGRIKGKSERMATTFSLMDSWVFVTTLLKNQRLNVNNMQPGLQMGNNVLGIMLGPPFAWPFNRSNLEIAITHAAGTDYNVSAPELDHIETQWLNDANGGIFELKGATSMAKVSTKRRPMTVAPVYDDNEGNITFRFNSLPDQNYIASFDYQRKATKLTSPASTFGPIPDQFAYLYNKGMLSEGALLVNDARFTIWRREFIAGVLATQDGLDEQAKSIFYDQMMNTGRTAVRSQSAGQSGAAGRGL
jgi:hypothetical protein